MLWHVHASDASDDARLTASSGSTDIDSTMHPKQNSNNGDSTSLLLRHRAQCCCDGSIMAGIDTADYPVLTQPCTCMGSHSSLDPNSSTPCTTHKTFSPHPQAPCRRTKIQTQLTTAQMRLTELEQVLHTPLRPSAEPQPYIQAQNLVQPRLSFQPQSLQKRACLLTPRPCRRTKIHLTAASGAADQAGSNPSRDLRSWIKPQVLLLKPQHLGLRPQAATLSSQP